ncbi:NAD(P)-binding protein [Xylariaceae sp. FL0255]|nr:NAD(P)-binding protein [Xylariaceae sp. FL0255]
MEGGTIIITGANGSLAIHAISHILSKSPKTTLILTVRNTSNSDPNTNTLRETITRFPDTTVSIRPLDLSHLQSVSDFCSKLSAEIREGKIPPIRGIVANAFHWNLVSPAEVTGDNLEKTMQVNHISHASLVLRLLASFDPEAGGRVVLFTSDAHFPGRNGLERYPAAILDDIDELVRVGAWPGSGNRDRDGYGDGNGLGSNDDDKEKDYQGRGMQRYANSKLVVLMWAYALNRRLEKSQNPTLNNIAAIAIDPGNLTDSRALRTNTPAMLTYMQRLVLQPLRPVLRLIAPDLRRASEAGVDVAELVLDRKEKYRGVKGYLRLMVEGPSSDESLDEMKQEALWDKTLEWARVGKKETVLLEDGI